MNVNVVVDVDVDVVVDVVLGSAEGFRFDGARLPDHEAEVLGSVASPSRFTLDRREDLGTRNWGRNWGGRNWGRSLQFDSFGVPHGQVADALVGVGVGVGVVLGCAEAFRFDGGNWGRSLQFDSFGVPYGQVADALVGVVLGCAEAFGFDGARLPDHEAEVLGSVASPLRSALEPSDFDRRGDASLYRTPPSRSSRLVLRRKAGGARDERVASLPFTARETRRSAELLRADVAAGTGGGSGKDCSTRTRYRPAAHPDA